MAENRRPSQRYLSGRVKVTAKAGLGTDRHLYLSPSDAEPNLGYPGEKSVPISGTYYRLITIPNGNTYDRYWQVDSPATLVDGISIFDEGTLVGTANSVSKINFVGSAITATASGSISTVSVSPPGTDKQILFHDLDDFGAANQLFYDKANNRLGLGNSNPTQQLHISNDFRIGGMIWDQHNQVGGAGSVLIAAGAGVSWSRSLGANVTVSPTAPSGAVNGDLWWDSEDGDLNVYYEDVDSSAWVSANANADQEDGVWTLDAIGIHTLSNVGIGTTMASVALAVGGNAIFGGALGGTGIVTATEFHGTFVGSGLGIAGVGGTWASNSTGIHTTKNVGIGSTLPGEALVVSGITSLSYLNVTGVGTFPDIKVETHNDTRLTLIAPGAINLARLEPTIHFKVDKAHNFDTRIVQQHDGLIFDTGGNGTTAERLRITKDGDVTIGTGISSIRLGKTGVATATSLHATHFKSTGISTFVNVELDSTLIDIHGQVGAARSVLTATGAGVSWGRGGSGVKIDEDPPTDNYDADLWWESDTGEMHIWYDDGTSAAWVSVSQGPAGVQGAQGAQGAQGHQGHQGKQGATGAQGHQGQVGAQGVQGAQGRQGAQGIPGPQGAQGAQGVQGATGATGAQGHQGHQGVQGAQGATGTAGAQGHQGVQGAQGHQGATGATGAQGVQGAQGAPGAQGAQGAEGNFGGVTFDYTYLTDNADSDPGAGKLKFNGTALHTTSPLIMYIDDVDDGSRDIQTYLRTIDDSTSTLKGHFRISNKSDSTDYAIFSITGGSTEASGYFKIPCLHLDGATSFSNNEDIIITFARTGDKGDAGTAGAQGAQGAQGHQGATGATGAQGAQGAQGRQGAQGATGSGGGVGAQGAQGAQGHQGATGAQGVQGAQGHQGHQGVQGSTGGGGGTGAQGHQGVQGAQGRQGATGAAGAQGAQGAEGDSGMNHSNKTSQYTLVAGDDQKLITTNSRIDVNQNIFSTADAITIYNNSGGNIEIHHGPNVTLRLAGTGTTGTRTLASRGIATIVCVASNEFVVSGGGLS